MAKDTIIRNVTIRRLERLNNSYYGNPRWRVTLSDGTVASTQSDASFNYEISNPEWRDALVDVTLTPAGRIRWMRHATPTPAESARHERSQVTGALSDAIRSLKQAHESSRRLDDLYEWDQESAMTADEANTLGSEPETADMRNLASEAHDLALSIARYAGVSDV